MTGLLSECSRSSLGLVDLLGIADHPEVEQVLKQRPSKETIRKKVEEVVYSTGLSTKYGIYSRARARHQEQKKKVKVFEPQLS